MARAAASRAPNLPADPGRELLTCISVNGRARAQTSKFTHRALAPSLPLLHINPACSRVANTTTRTEQASSNSKRNTNKPKNQRSAPPPYTMAAPRRSRRIASQEPEELGLVASVTRRAKKPREWDVAAATARACYGTQVDRAFVLSLTKAKRAAIIETAHERINLQDGRISQQDGRISQQDDEISALTQRNNDLERRAAAAEKVAGGRRDLRADSIQQQLLEKMQERRAAADAARASVEAAVGVAASEPVSAPPSPPHAPAPPASPMPLWRRAIGTATSYLSPFAKRKHVTEAETAADQLPPAPKRAKIVDTRGETPQDHVDAPEMATPAEAPAQHSPRKRSHATASATEQQQQTTPQMSAGRAIKTPRSFLMPSTKNRRVPTSLSTVTEVTERTEHTAPAPPTHAIQATPQVDISDFGSSMIMGTTPSRAPHRRTISSVRAARQSTPQHASRLSWDQRSLSVAPAPAAPEPTEPQDQDLGGKLLRMKQLQEELAQLHSDPDVAELEAHRRKRVKVDDLAYIPHNLPGESEGTFRVPEWDSDDEMEVSWGVPERANVFGTAAQEDEDEGQQQQQQQQHDDDETAAEEEKEEEEAVPAFAFPSVGKKDPGLEPLAPAVLAQASTDFAAGLAAFRKARE
ncbi:hypothetical protein LTR53_001983 [Teratosphaeriaceae sp. CCFEE 6253]|nr:hypothetical protein LTR53_001983 [Teratosphaeriaceae sp. CCFEE 6253]